MTAPLPVREYANEAEMKARYAEIRRNTWAPRHVEPKPPAYVVRERFIPVALMEPTPEEVAANALIALEKRAAFLRDARLADLDAMHFRPVSLLILRIVSEVTGFEQDALCSDSRVARLVRARQIAMFLMVRAKASLPSVGRALGHRDHTTVLHGARKARAVARLLGVSHHPDAVEVTQRLWAKEWPRVTRLMMRDAS
jgi:hypothetical protein